MSDFSTLQIQVPDYIKEINKIVLANDSFIAGGCLRALFNKETVRDVDVFSTSPDAHLITVLQLKSNGFDELFSNPMLTRLTKNTITIDAVKPRVAEFMCTQGTPQEVISHFDFTVARAALINNDSMLADVDFEKDCQEKRLNIKHIVCPLGQVKRIAKYTSKGYKISLVEISKLFSTFQERGMNQAMEMLGRKDLSVDELAELMKWVYVD